MPIRLVLILLTLLPCRVFAADPIPFAEREVVQGFLARVQAQHQLEAEQIARWIDGVTSDERVLELIARPAEKTLSWPEYRAIFIGAERIAAGRRFMQDNKATLARAEAQFGVPQEVIAAIIGVESFYGRHRGSHAVLRALLTLGFEYPRRASFFQSELEAFLVLASAEGWAADTVFGSYAGAMGWPQFISSSYSAYAIDFDGDGKRDLFDSQADVIGSVGNYLARHGWAEGEPMLRPWPGDAAPPAALQELASDELKPQLNASQLGLPALAEGSIQKVNLFRVDDPAGGDQWWVGYMNLYVITRYNHSRLYALAVHELSAALAGPEPSTQ